MFFFSRVPLRFSFWRTKRRILCRMIARLNVTSGFDSSCSWVYGKSSYSFLGGSFAALLFRDFFDFLDFVIAQAFFSMSALLLWKTVLVVNYDFINKDAFVVALNSVSWTLHWSWRIVRIASAHKECASNSAYQQFEFVCFFLLHFSLLSNVMYFSHILFPSNTL